MALILAGCDEPKRAGVCSAPLFVTRSGDLLHSVVSASAHASAAAACAEHSGVVSSDIHALRQAAQQNASWSSFWLGHVPVHYPSTGWVWQSPGQGLPSGDVSLPPPAGLEHRVVVSSSSLLSGTTPIAPRPQPASANAALCVARDTVHHRPDRCPAGWAWFDASASCVFVFDHALPQLDAAAACTAHQSEMWLPALYTDVDAWLQATGHTLWTAAAPSGGSWSSVYTGDPVSFSVFSASLGMDGVVWNGGLSLMETRLGSSLARAACVRPAGSRWAFHKFSVCPYGWIPLEGHCIRSSHSSQLSTVHNYADAQRQCAAWGGTVLASPGSKLAMSIVAAATWLNTNRSDVSGVWTGVHGSSGGLEVSGFPARNACASGTASLWQPACPTSGTLGYAAMLAYDLMGGMTLSLQPVASEMGFVCSIADSDELDVGCPSGWILLQGRCYRLESTNRLARDHELACSAEPSGSYLAPLPNMDLWALMRQNLGRLGTVTTNVLIGMRRAGLYPVAVEDRLAVLPGVAAGPRALSCVPMRQAWMTSTGERIGRAAWAGAQGTGDPPSGADDLICTGGDVDHGDRAEKVVAYVPFTVSPNELVVADVESVGNSLSVQGLCARKPRSAVFGVTGCSGGWTELAGKCVRLVQDNILLPVQAAELITKHCAANQNTAVFSPRGFLHRSLFSSGLLSFLLDNFVTVGVTNRFTSPSLLSRPDAYLPSDGFGSGALLWAEDEPLHNRRCIALRVSNNGLLEDVRCGDGDGIAGTKSVACERPMASPCPAGWWHLRVAGNVDGERTADRCYLANSAAMSEPAARAHCQSLHPELGSDLVSLDSYWELYHVLGIIKTTLGSQLMWVGLDASRWPLPGAADTGPLALVSTNCPLFRFTTATAHGYDLTPFSCLTETPSMCEMSMPGGSFGDTTPPGVMAFPRCGEYGASHAAGCGSQPWVRPSASATPQPATATVEPSPLATPSVTPVSFSPTPTSSLTPAVSPSAAPSPSTSATASTDPTQSATSAATVSSTSAATVSSTSAATVSSTSAATVSSTSAATVSSTSAATVSSTSAATVSSTSSTTQSATPSATVAVSQPSEPTGQPAASSSASPSFSDQPAPATPASTASPTSTPYVQRPRAIVSNNSLLASTSVSLTVAAALIPGTDREARLRTELQGSVVVSAVESALAACGAHLAAGLGNSSVLGSFWAREAPSAWWWVVRESVSVACSDSVCWADLPIEMQLQARQRSRPLPSSGAQLLPAPQRKVLTAHVLFAVIGDHNLTRALPGRRAQASVPDGAVKTAAGMVAKQDPSAVLAAGYTGSCRRAESASVPSEPSTWCSGSDERVSVTNGNGVTDDWDSQQTSMQVFALEAASNRLVTEQGTSSDSSQPASFGAGAIAGLVAAIALLAVGMAGLVRYQRQTKELQGQVQAAKAKVLPSAVGPRTPVGPAVLKAAPPDICDMQEAQKEASSREALPAVAADVSTGSVASDHTAVAVSPGQPGRVASSRLLSMPLTSQRQHSAKRLQAPFALEMATFNAGVEQYDHCLPHGVDTGSTAGSARTRPSVEAMNMYPDEHPFPLRPARGGTGAAGGIQPPFASDEVHQGGAQPWNEFGVTLASEATAESHSGNASVGVHTVTEPAKSTLASPRRYSQLPARSLAALQCDSMDSRTAKAAQRLGLHDAEVDYSSDSSGADAYVDGQSSGGRGGSTLGSQPELPFAAGGPPAAAAAKATAQLPAGVHVSMRYQQRKQQEAAFNAAVGGGGSGSVAGSDSTINLSTEIWTVSQASQILQTHGRMSPFAPNLSGGGEQLEVPQLSLGLGAHGVAAASRLTMSSAGTSGELPADDQDGQDKLASLGSWQEGSSMPAEQGQQSRNFAEPMSSALQAPF